MAENRLRLLIVGLAGKMGRACAELCAGDGRIDLVGGLDPLAPASYEPPCPLYRSAAAVDCAYDVALDFSHPALLPELEALVASDCPALVVATTGYDAAGRARLDALARRCALFTSANMSLGINLLSRLADKAAQILFPRYDIEIVEAHHRRKLDAPSGTALFLAEGIRKALNCELALVTERAARRCPRPEREIGLSSVRGGSIVGEHEVIFAGEDEVISLKHSAGSRRLFAVGALEAACFLRDKAPGAYSMDELFSEILAEA